MALKTVLLPMLMRRKRQETSVVTLMLTMGTFIRGCTYAISFAFGSALSRENAHLGARKKPVWQLYTT